MISFSLKRILKFLISYESQLIYEKLPQDISERHVLLLDPVLATGTLSLLSSIFDGFFLLLWTLSLRLLILLEGNSANQAIELLIQKGVPESHIIFLNLISVSVEAKALCFSLSLSTNYYYNIVLWQAPEGIHCVCKRFPALKIVTSEIDQCLNQEFRVIPGLGEFGDRYFGTDE